MTHKLNKSQGIVLLLIISALLLAACSAETPEQSTPNLGNADVEYTLLTASEGSRYWFVGVGGEIDGQINPDLKANVGDVVAITLINDDGKGHDVVITEFNAATSIFRQVGQSETIEFTVDQEGTFFYFCSVGSHRRNGMEGQLIVAADG
jgi:nitrite reductase (NO-forming)